MNIKELAKQAGIGFNDGSDLHTTIKRFAELVAAAEREACAKLCLEQDEYGCGQYAKAIRARGDKHD